VDIGSLALGRGEQMLLTAGSGQGKSTLLQLIAGLLEPDGGRVEVDGQSVHALHGARRDLFRGRTVGMIFQTFNLLHGFTALENVMAAMMFSAIPRREHRDRAAALLSHLGIERHGAEPDRLSVGQQQRVAVARAVACDPVLVLADEPTASLDPENAATAMDLIQAACREKGAALLCTSHDPSMRERFPRRAALAELGSGGAKEYRPPRAAVGGTGGTPWR
jgi:ABC-type lipoprotein export system ATPase subunit